MFDRREALKQMVAAPFPLTFADTVAAAAAAVSPASLGPCREWLPDLLPAQLAELQLLPRLAASLGCHVPLNATPRNVQLCNDDELLLPALDDAAKLVKRGQLYVIRQLFNAACRQQLNGRLPGWTAVADLPASRKTQRVASPQYVTDTAELNGVKLGQLVQSLSHDLWPELEREPPSHFEFPELHVRLTGYILEAFSWVNFLPEAAVT